MNLHVICAFRNRPDLLEPSLESIDSQTDPDFTVHVGNDDSDEDGVDEALARWRERRPDWDFHTFRPRIGVIGNQATMIRETPMAPEDVIVFLDGDDRFAHPEVISRLREVYSSPAVDLTYGNYRPDPPHDGCPPVKPIPPEVCADTTYRRWAQRNGTCWNHLRTFRRRIFDAIPDSYMKMRGQWLDGGADYALMTPALELAGGRHFMFDEVLVLYTSDRPDAEWRSKSEGIAKGRRYTASRRALKPIPPLTEIPT